MRKLVPLLVLLFAVSAFAQPEVELTHLNARLLADDELPTASPGDPDGSGFAIVSVQGTTLRWYVAVQNVATPSTVRIVRNAPLSAGPIVAELTGTFTNGVGSGSTAISNALAAELVQKPGNFSIVVANAEFAGGAVRGNLTGSEFGPSGFVFYLPVAGKVRGANNTNFVTDLRVVNPDASPAVVTMEWFPTSRDNSTSSQVRIHMVPGSSQLALDDVTAQFENPGLGAMRIQSRSRIHVYARVNNDLRAQGLGTTGFALAPVAQTELRTHGVLPFLVQTATHRTNIGWFNPSSTPVRLSISTRTAAGTGLGVTIDVPPRAMVQRSLVDLFSGLPAERDQPNLFVTWTATEPMIVYASVVDNTTGDSVYID